MKRRTKKAIRTIMWYVIMFVAIGFGIYMYFSGTFLAEMLIRRKIIYIALAIVAGTAFAHILSD